MAFKVAQSLFSKAWRGFDKVTDAPFTKTGATGRFIADIGKGEKPGWATKGLIGLPTTLELGSLGVDPVTSFVDELQQGASKGAIANHKENLYQMRRRNVLKEQLQEYQMKMQEAIRQLAIYDPQKYQEVLAGRELPQGAVVIGGAPRVDLLQQFANDAAMQGLPGPDPASLNMSPPNPMGELGIGL